MGKNNVQNLTPAEMVELANQMHGPLSAPDNGYGVPPSHVSVLASLSADLAAANADVIAAKAAYHAAVDARSAQANGVSATIASIARLVYGNGQCTPNMISALGLSPRSRSRARIVPQMPTGLLAVAQEDRSILVSFDPNGNPYGVVYQVEAQTGSGWETVAITTATKAEVAGFAPGTAVSFRVVAVKNGRSSAPSGEAVPYGASIAPALRLAA